MTATNWNEEDLAVLIDSLTFFTLVAGYV